MLKQGQHDSVPGASPSGGRSAGRRAGGVWFLGLWLWAGSIAPGMSASAHAQGAAQGAVLVLVGSADGADAALARAVFASLLAELREAHPDRPIRADTRRALSERVSACRQDRCRASLALREHASALLVVGFPAPDEGQEQRQQQGQQLQITLDVYDEGGALAGRHHELPLAADSLGAFRPALRAALAQVALPLPSSARLRIACSVRGARVWMDGQPAGAIPLRLMHVRPGRHEVRVLAPGFDDFVARLDVPPEGARLDIRLVRSASR